ncbi:DivIVA domain-containing protein [Ekhidna sp. To15]|uniref:DivIVA domain-containing protein n=1 Tax=Ekhidna sp. To15 TaxID=3395267 RepID=UPI003F521F20
MKITPLEIRQKDFEKKLRGYDKDEVSAFLQSLSNEWERMLEENKEANLKLQQAEKEVAKLREVETSLYKTLKTAEDTGANVIDQANKAAELHMKETKMNAEALLSESKNKARAMIEQAEMEARQIIEELQDAVKGIEQNHRDIENHRQNALQELKNLSVTLIEKVERNTGETKEFKFDDYVKRVKKLARESEDRIKSEKTEVQVETKSIDPLPKETEAPKEESKKPEVEVINEPPKTEELRERIIQKTTPPTPPPEPEAKVEPVKEEKVVDKGEPKEELNIKSPEEPEAPKEEEAQAEEAPEKAEVVEKEETVEDAQEEKKKGPRISKTVSFFDELDTD